MEIFDTLKEYVLSLGTTEMQQSCRFNGGVSKGS